MEAIFLDEHVNGMELSHDPYVLLLWKPKLLARGHYVRPDALVRYERGAVAQTLLLEIDEDGIAPASRRREELLDLPTLRLTPDDLIHPNFFKRLLRRVARLAEGDPAQKDRERRKSARQMGWMSPN